MLSLIAAARSTIAAQPDEATISRIVNNVQLRPGQEAPRAAVLNDNVPDGTTVATGMDSRTELTFADQTSARLSANTIFSFDKGTRTATVICAAAARRPGSRSMIRSTINR